MYENIYNPETVAEYFNEVLETLLPVEGFAEIDKTLISKPGLEITIWRYSDSGEAEQLEIGEGNSGYSDAEGVAYKYIPKRVQDRVKLYDDDISLNPNVANYKMSIAPKHLVNKMRHDVIKSWYDTDNTCEVASTSGIPTVSELILAQSYLDLGVDNGINNGNGGEKLCLFLSSADYRKFQAYLSSENVIIASEVINGKRLNTVAGIPFDASDYVQDGHPIFATNKAVRLCYNQCKPTGSERDENTCLSTYYARTYYVSALEFIKKALVFGHSAVTITKTAPSNGTFDVLAKQVPSARVYIKNIQPAAGYELDTITVVDGDGAAVEVDEHNSFVMPESGATVTVTFAAV